MNIRRVVLGVGGILVVGFLLIQVLPVGNISPLLQFPDNPAVVQAIQWDSPETEALLRRACFDCHSNETTWPWYSRIAPVSWLVYKDVNDGRRQLNFSDLRLREGAGELVQEVEHHVHRDMPPQIYTIMHPDAVLSDADKQAVIDGVAKTFAAGPSSAPDSVVPPEGGDQDSDND